MDYQFQLVADHVPSKEANATLTVSVGSGKQAVIPGA
jgi:hypothetical protein